MIPAPPQLIPLVSEKKQHNLHRATSKAESNSNKVAKKARIIDFSQYDSEHLQAARDDPEFEDNITVLNLREQLRKKSAELLLKLPNFSPFRLLLFKENIISHKFRPHYRKFSRNIDDRFDITDYYLCAVQEQDLIKALEQNYPQFPSVIVYPCRNDDQYRGDDDAKASDSSAIENLMKSGQDQVALDHEKISHILQNGINKKSDACLGFRYGGLFHGGFSSATNNTFRAVANITRILCAARGMHLFPTHQQYLTQLGQDCVERKELDWDDSVSQKIDESLLEECIWFIEHGRRGMNTLSLSSSSPSPLTPSSSSSSSSSPSSSSSSSSSSSLTAQPPSVLVHCAAGRSRSATILVAYIASFCDITITKALSFLQSKRTCAQPNRAFLKQLIEFENQGLFKRLHQEIHR